jgi:hypothetical protein
MVLQWVETDNLGHPRPESGGFPVDFTGDRLQAKIWNLVGGENVLGQKDRHQ